MHYYVQLQPLQLSIFVTLAWFYNQPLKAFTL